MAAPPRKRSTEESRAWTRYMGIGAQLIGMIGICVGIGLYADSQLGTNPWITIVMSLVGVIGGLYVSVKDLL
ncbi:AtpZ/AtpI family protein [Neolewinella sp.]|uniref:AtpZ/AtpI family protein n=1 Tax=Neolewinella sp. TaxID=2993543 RepID=UPI003B5266B4